MAAMAAELQVPWDVNSEIARRHDGTRFPQAEAAGPNNIEQLYRGPLRQAALSTDTGDGVQCSCARSVRGHLGVRGRVYRASARRSWPAASARRRSTRSGRRQPVLNWIRGLTLQDFEACRDCSHRTFCKRSSGSVFADYGNYTGPQKFGDEWACMEAELVHELVDDDQTRAARARS